jgi:hypothetical protein
MNGNPWFDDVSRVVGSGMPRRQAIRMILGGLAGLTVGVPFPRRAGARACPSVPCTAATAGTCRASSFVECVGNTAHKCIYTGCDSSNQCTLSESIFLCGTLHCVGGECICLQDADCNKGEVCCGGQCCKKHKKNGTSCQDAGCCTKTAKFRPSALRSGPPAQMDVTVQDAENGVCQILPTLLINTQVYVPGFTPGTTDPIVVTATKLSSALPSQFELMSSTCDACTQNGDPVLTVLRIAEGEERFRETFAGLPAAERYVRVQNGYPGLPRVDVHVNGRPAGSLRLGREEVAMLDIGPFMTKLGGNIVTLVGFGRPGHSALVVVSDDPGTSGKASAGLPLVEWDSGSFPPGQNLRWGR